MLHELWIESEGEQTFCQVGIKGDGARKMLLPGAKLIWSVEAASHFEAMTKYYEHMGWGEYTSDFPDIDKRPYSESDEA